MCGNKHVDEKCIDQNCEIRICEKSPRTYSYYRDFGMCKFTIFCKFEHTNLENKIKDLK